MHRLSPRSRKPFVAINCAAIPEALLEAELFGHTRGAFTGAVKGRTGRIEAADGGTLFLDEIGEMPLALQSKLLRFVECGELQRVGDNETVRVDVRIVAATHQALAQQTQAGTFRSDLYYRLAVSGAKPSAVPGIAPAATIDLMGNGPVAPGVRIAAVVEDPSPPLKRYDPGHPDAGPDGYVSYPDINPLTEMVDLMGATRAYGLNGSAVQAEKGMITTALEIAKS